MLKTIKKNDFGDIVGNEEEEDDDDNDDDDDEESKAEPEKPWNV